MWSKQRAYTIVELVTAIAILVVLVGLAVVSIEIHLIRRQVRSALEVTAETRRSVEDVYRRTDRVPENLVATGTPTEPELAVDGFVSTVEVLDGQVIIVFGHQASARISGQSLVLTPYGTASGHVVWRCGNGPAPKGLEPLEKEIRVTGSPSSDVADWYLPPMCREGD